MAPLVEHQYARGRVWHRWDSSETVYGPITQLENQPPRRVGHPHFKYTLLIVLNEALPSKRL